MKYENKWNIRKSTQSQVKIFNIKYNTSVCKCKCAVKIFDFEDINGL